jgi:hypothetical protein
MLKCRVQKMPFINEMLKGYTNDTKYFAGRWIHSQNDECLKGRYGSHKCKTIDKPLPANIKKKE